MCSKRMVWFLIMMGIGIAGGLVYAWFLNPVQYVDTAPQSLRDDYKADYVLMVAELYQEEQDLELARARLSFLGTLPAQQITSQGILSAQKYDYALADLEVMNRLLQALHASPGEQP
jgi:hypothetical protein